MNINDFDYVLPEHLIAQMPADKRENSKMLVLDRVNKSFEDKHFYDFTDYFSENDILVLNNTKVLPARIFGLKDTGAKIEILLLNPAQNIESANRETQYWSALIKPSKRIKEGTVISVSPELKIKVLNTLEDAGEWLIELNYSGEFIDILHKVGNIPLPPYIERKLQTEEQRRYDRIRYQTVYAKDEGSVAAPTAGLHFTEEILKRLEDKGVEIAYVTLDVGLGTFRPVKCENILEHKMHSEAFEITKEAADIINRAKSKGKKLTAVGTTTVRTLETAYQKYGCIKACRDSSELFIYPPYEFKVVDKLLTNFHLPKSTLLMLVSAFAGKEYVFEAYRHAVENSYRFFSYGDCMLIL